MRKRSGKPYWLLALLTAILSFTLVIPSAVAVAATTVYSSGENSLFSPSFSSPQDYPVLPAPYEPDPAAWHDQWPPLASDSGTPPGNSPTGTSAPLRLNQPPPPDTTPTQQGTVDYDADDDGLIEVSNLAQLNAIRGDPDGDGVATESAYGEAFPGAVSGMGCPGSGCVGYELTANLDFDTNGNGRADAGDAYWNGGTGWFPIGDFEDDSSTGFSATFEGGGHTISNLYINRGDPTRLGLFGWVESNGTIGRIGLVSVDVTGAIPAGQTGWVGSLAGINSGTITNSYATGRVTANNSYTGGLAGRSSGTISGSHAAVNVTLGVTGDDHDTTRGTLIHSGGGLIGGGSGTVTNSSATGDVTGNVSQRFGGFGGLAGGTCGDVITNSYATGNVSGSATGSGHVSVGGLVGSNSSGNISNSYATGGLAGIPSSANAGPQGDAIINLVEGDAGAFITASYSEISETDQGDTASVPNRVTGSGNADVGGLVGDAVTCVLDEIPLPAPTVTDSYWDTQTSGQSSSAGGIGKTTGELQSPASNTGIYASWDPAVWDFGTSSQYPTLRSGGSPTPTPSSPITSDRDVLVILYNATDGDNWTNNTSWLSDAPIGQWHGVTTNSSGRVTELNLYENDLSGEIPAALGNLSDLRVLHLANRSLICDSSGCRPDSPSGNRLTGEIPPALGNLSNLQVLLLHGNELSGEIPAQLGTLSNLASLNLYANRLSGEIPAGLGNLPNLVHLSLGSNQLNGSIPAELGNLTNLSTLYLARNQLTGCVPAALRDVGENDFDDLGLPFCGDSTASASYKMYWTVNDKIQRANLDGSQVEDLVTLGLFMVDPVTSGLYDATGIALDLSSGKMYWTADGMRGISRVQRANLDGSQVEDLVTSGLYRAAGIALDLSSGKMYWTQNGKDSPGCGEGKVQRANLDGSRVEDLVTSGLCHPAGMALDLSSGKMYWTDRGFSRVQRANLDGSRVEDLVRSGDTWGIALDLAVGKMYWGDNDLDRGTTKIRRANLDGSGAEDLVTSGLDYVEGLALDLSSGKMYWTDSGKIQRANLDGSQVEDLVTSAQGHPGYLAIATQTAEDAPPPPVDCGETLTGDGMVNGTWAAGCDSEIRDGSHARYYTFTLSQQAEVTITLERESGNADTYLYLREGDARSGTALHENDDDGDTTRSRIQETLAAGTYTIEATTYDPGQTGSFTLTIEGLDGAPPLATGCVEDLGALTVRVDRFGTWTEDCPSGNRSGSHARFYSFSLPQETEVTIRVSSSFDTYLYLLEGTGADGTVLEENDDLESGNPNSGLTVTLAAGSYTVEATTFRGGITGGFDLSIEPEGAIPPTPVPGGCIQTMGPLVAAAIRHGSWTGECDSGNRPGSHARYYSFTLDLEAEVQVDLTSSVDTYLYLLDGVGTGGTIMDQNDDVEDGSGSTNSRINITLQPGEYTVEATTFAEGATGDFTLEVVPGILGPPPPSCLQALTGDGTGGGEWVDNCHSETREGSYARFYTFTLPRQSEVTITLTRTSGDADTYLYLREGTTRSGMALHENDDHDGLTVSQIEETLAAGSYTIEATTFSAGQTGSFTLAVSGLGGAPPVTDTCVQTLDGDGTVRGKWLEGCQSEAPGRGYARYYSFTLDQSSEVTITLESQDADTYLYLREDDARSGDYLYQNDDAGSTARSQIRETLAAGAYTIEATTYDEGVTGDFTLTISGLGDVGEPPPPDACEEPLTGNGTISGAWVAECESEVPERGYAKYYGFTLDQPSRVTITLESQDADTYLYLREDDARSGTALHYNDDHQGSRSVSQIGADLEAGAYTIEATTYGQGETGSFTLTIEGLPGRAGSIESDREALVALYNATGGDSWTNNDNWLSEEAIRQWHGVSGDSDGRARVVALSSNGLDGTLPAALGDLDRLERLFLAGNQLGGPIPPELGDLSRIEVLHLNSNQLDGTIPALLGNLAGLTSLRLNTNQLTGEIPASLGNLDNLQVLGLSGNQLTGCVPEGLRDVPDNDIALLGLPYCGDTPEPTPPEECSTDLGTLTESTTRTGSWGGDCPTSLRRTGSHTRFYTFRLAQDSVLTINLSRTSGNADTYLYLVREEERNVRVVGENDDYPNAGDTDQSQLDDQELAAGTYTIEATTFAAGQTGEFTLTITGLGDGGPAQTDECLEDLGVLGMTPGRVSIGRIGQTWTSHCSSTNEAGSYARYYAFTLLAPGEVTITLESRDADPYLYLLQGAGRNGTVEAENDDHEGSRIRSQIEETLEAGTYTIEATTYTDGQTGRFNLTIIEPATLSPQGVALAALYEATGGDNWTNNENWADASKRLGEWYGVTTDEQGQVIGLDLNDNGLTGELPPGLDWGAFTDLEWLNLGDNQLTGQIPAELSDLSQLLVLDLGDNRLNGPIPPQLGNLSGLTRLRLNGNRLSGPIPPQLSRLSNLRVAYLSENRLAGQIPAELGSITYLRVLDLDDNLLRGPIPGELGNPSELQWLNLERNQLTGEIPAALGNLSSLDGLRLHSNLLTGSIPAALGNLSNLTGLRLDNNQLTGSIPAALGNLSNLTSLRLHNNQLTGEIPEEFGLLLDLSVLHLAGSNQLTGCIPNALRDVSENDFNTFGLAFCTAVLGPTLGGSPDRAALVALYNATGGANWQDNDNWLTDAPIGEWDGVITDDAARVIALLLHNNRLTGTLPPDLGNLSNLRWLRMGGNRLTREIPGELGNLSELRWLSLESNRLSGTIPDALGNLSSLEALHLRNNRLDGGIPSGLGRLANLIVLDLGRNRLTGEIPPDLGRLSNLRFLYLDDQDYFRGKQGHPTGWDPAYLLDDSNYLHGEIPSALGNLSNLEALDLRHNRLSGPIPPALGRLSNLVSLSVNRNFLSGSIPPELYNLSNLEALDLRRNRMSGEIPSALDSLSNLTDLRLIGNPWSGCVPAALRDVPNNDLDHLYQPSCTRSGTSTTLDQQFNPASSHENQDDRATLESILAKSDVYKGWNKLPDWGSNESIGDWYGVTISDDILSECHGRVTKLEISGKHLSGPTPPQLGNLSCLTELELSKTTHRCRRGWVIFSRCGLTGELPSTLSSLPLTNVDVSNNRLQTGLKRVWSQPQTGSVTPFTLLFEGNPWEGEDKPWADAAGAATSIGVDKLQGKLDDAFLEGVENRALVVARREGGKRVARVFFRSVPVAGQVYTAYQWVDFTLGGGELPVQDYLDLAKGVVGVAEDIIVKADPFAVQGLLGGVIEDRKNHAYNTCLHDNNLHVFPARAEKACAGLK